MPKQDDIKALKPLTLCAAEPRFMFALSLPYKSSPKIRIYREDNLTSELWISAAEYVSKYSIRQLVSKSSITTVIVIPKWMRLYMEDFVTWRDNSLSSPSKKAKIDEPSKLESDELSESKAPSAARFIDGDDNVSDWDRAEGRAGSWRLNSSPVSLSSLLYYLRHILK